MNILVTGVEGYIGSVLAPYLIERGHSVTGLDTGFYREGWLYHPQNVKSPACIHKDLRRITEEDLNGFEAVVHLAELSNDPLGQHNPELTYNINHLGTVALAEKCKKAGLSRFVYTSSCSVYGVGSGEFKNESSETNPQTAYARCKTLVERDLSLIAGDDFSPSFLRNATAYGASPHMRPLVHDRDIARAIACTLEAPRDLVHNQIFNVGSTSENYQVRNIAEIVADTFPSCRLSFGKSDGDSRSYRVCFDKIHSQLPGFNCRYNAAMGAGELLELFQLIDMAPEVFNFRPYTRLKQLQYLLKTGQIDAEFYWTAKNISQSQLSSAEFASQNHSTAF
jgi:nucleoside-diphosphate-sugar epimerase